MLCYIRCNFMLRYITCYVVLCLSYVIQHVLFMSYYTTCYLMLRYITCYVVLHHVILSDVIEHVMFLLCYIYVI